MNLILGATGRVGSVLVANLLKKGQPVRAVIRSSVKAPDLISKGVEVFVADYFDGAALKKAFQGGSSVFLLTPENPECNDFINESRTIINNYREAIISAKINKIIGLSSGGAQHESGTGNLVASYLLEHSFASLENEQTFVRPAYYYSNWMGYLELVKEHGILPTFFPPEMKLPMVAPADVGAFLAELMSDDTPHERIYEISGPYAYSSSEIAQIFATVLERSVTVQQVSPEAWESTLLQAGFSQDGARNLMLMTKAVIDGRTKDTTPNPIRCATDFKTYLKNIINI